MVSVRIMQGDCREVLRSLPAASVHCCVTSPPYYGLRDYQTGLWEGGDPACDHESRSKKRNAGSQPGTGNAGNVLRDGIAGVIRRCHCGAHRIDRQIGLEESPEAYVAELVAVFREVRRVLRDDGTLWLNLGDSYSGGKTGRTDSDRNARMAEAYGCGRGIQSSELYDGGRQRAIPEGLKPKDLIGIPWLVAFALRADGWYLRSEIIWHKPNPMPESVTDRPTNAHESIFLLSKSRKYFYDAEAVRESCSDKTEWTYAQPDKAARAGITTNGTGKSTMRVMPADGARNLRNVWTVATQPFSWGQETVRQIRVEADADVDGKKRKASPNCPVHGDPGRQASNGSGGGRGASPASRSRSNDDHRVPEQLDGFAPIETSREPGTAQHSSDSPGLGYSASATGHNNGSHRTDPVPATNPAYSVSAETHYRIDGTLGPLDSYERDRDTPESRTAAAGSVDSRDNQTAGGTVRTSSGSAFSSAYSDLDCTCEYYIEVTAKVDHFATFPPDLIEPCIKAGTSEKGCCAKCGAPWVRDVETVKSWREDAVDYEQAYRAGSGNPRVRSSSGGMSTSQYKTIGWSRGCLCAGYEHPVPCTVLDPFFGAGTTGLVADRLQRNCIGIELNPDYASMARKRLADDRGGLLDWLAGESTTQAAGAAA